MRKFLLKILLSATALLAFGGFVAPIAVRADEGVETPGISVENTDSDIVSSEEKTAENTTKEEAVESGDKWFDEVLMPMAVRIVAGVAGFTIAMMLCFKDFNKVKAVFAEAVKELFTSNDNNKGTAKAVAELEANQEKRIDEMEAMFVEKIEEITTMFVDALTEIKSNLSDKVNDADGKLTTLLEVEKLAYGDNAALVSNGTAKKIAEVVGYGKTETVNKK